MKESWATSEAIHTESMLENLWSHLTAINESMQITENFAQVISIFDCVTYINSNLKLLIRCKNIFYFFYFNIYLFVIIIWCLEVLFQWLVVQLYHQRFLRDPRYFFIKILDRPCIIITFPKRIGNLAISCLHTYLLEVVNGTGSAIFTVSVINVDFFMRH